MAFSTSGSSNNIWEPTPQEEIILGNLYGLWSVQNRSGGQETSDSVLEGENKENSGLPWPSLVDPSIGRNFPSSVSGPAISGTNDAAPAVKYCPFCKRNGEVYEIYTNHALKDAMDNVTCPILYVYKCPLCGATGPRAHTRQYCPKFKNDSNVVTTKRNSSGRMVHHYR